MSPGKEPPDFKQLSEEQRKALVKSLIRSGEKDRLNEGRDPAQEEITAREKWLALFGIPAEVSSHTQQNTPIATLLLIVFTSLFSLYFLFVAPQMGELFAFYPGAPFRLAGLSILTCFFVHGGIGHLAANMYCLYIFGDDVEDVLGIVRYYLLIVFATALGSVVSLIFSHGEMIPHVGASGGIFGVMIFYLLRFPKSKFTYLFFFRFVRVPAAGVLALYVLFQLFGAAGQVAGQGNVDHLAHIGGGLVGLFFWLALGRPREEEKRPDDMV